MTPFCFCESSGCSAKARAPRFVADSPTAITRRSSSYSPEVFSKTRQSSQLHAQTVFDLFEAQAGFTCHRGRSLSRAFIREQSWKGAALLVQARPQTRDVAQTPLALNCRRSQRPRMTLNCFGTSYDSARGCASARSRERRRHDPSSEYFDQIKIGNRGSIVICHRLSQRLRSFMLCASCLAMLIASAVEMTCSAIGSVLSMPAIQRHRLQLLMLLKPV